MTPVEEDTTLAELQAILASPKIREYGAGPKIREYGAVQMKDQAPRIICKSGGSLSVQASANMYCTPRANHGPYTEVEVGFPKGLSGIEQFLGKYAEDPSDLEGTVYGYVPIELVVFVIALNGGIEGVQA